MEADSEEQAAQDTSCSSNNHWKETLVTMYFSKAKFVTYRPTPGKEMPAHIVSAH